MNYSSLSSWFQYSAGICSVVAAGCTFFAVYFKAQSDSLDKRKKANVGTLSIKPGINVPRRVIELGPNGSRIDQGGPAGTPHFNFGGTSLLVEEVDGRLCVSTQIRDCDGKIIAELTKNEWSLGGSAIFDRNYTDDALEVRDQYGEVVFQVRLFPDRVQVQGKFVGVDGFGTAILGPAKKGEGSRIVRSTLPEYKEVRIEPIFRYPSSLHFGEFLKTEGRN